jgi:hypothetical protein
MTQLEESWEFRYLRASVRVILDYDFSTIWNLHLMTMASDCFLMTPPLSAYALDLLPLDTRFILSGWMHCISMIRHWQMIPSYFQQLVPLR